MALIDADVIIVGAGPAGSIAAYTLASAGTSVIVLEKATFPRYKVCGGGLTHKIIKEIPFDLSDVIESTIHTIRFSSGFESVFSRTFEVPLMYCTMRSALDNFMVDQAAQAGAKVLSGYKVTGIRVHPDSVTIETKEQSFRSLLVIGADGPSSIIARSSGLRTDILQGLAWEAEIRTDPEILKKYSDTVFLDWGAFPGGYGWVFPKKDHFSVGVGGPAALSRQMMPYYHGYMRYLGFDSDPQDLAHHGKSETLSLRSWPIPVRIRKGNFHSERILVAGDAGGLTDSLTGEGIYYAVRSGKLAAAACIDQLNGRSGSLGSYSEQVNEELMSELLEGNRIRNIFNAVPLKIHCFVRDSERAWRAFGKVLRGERSYLDVKSGFGKWKIFWNISSSLAGTWLQVKERSFRVRKSK